MSDFISKTSCDGSGVVVAVLDTGVDPGAPGLSATPDGRTKVVDVVDCTGSGDVDMSVEVEIPAGQDFVDGLSGRRLKLSPGIRALNPSGKYRLGLKGVFSFLPKPLVKRLKAERKDRWNISHLKIVNDINRKLQSLRKANVKQGSSGSQNQVGSESESDASRARKLEIEEYEARVAASQNAEKDYFDSGPVFDCVVFHDGENYRAIVDTSEKGDLGCCAILEDYHIHCKYAKMFEVVNYAVNMYNDGSILSIVVDGGAHGTHVAGIVSAYYEDAPQMNGMAPGTQIVSLKIGDTRLSSMETHQGLNRALAYLLLHSSKRAEAAPDTARTASKDKTKGQRNAGGDDDALSAANARSALGHESKMDINAPGRLRVESDSVEDNKSVHSDCPNSELAPSHIRRNPVLESVHETPQDRKDRILSTGRGADGQTIVVDVVNMSFGEPCHIPDRGRFVELVTQVVRERNVIFVCSAGNNGPGLSTVSAPGGTTDAVIGVGAYVTPRMLTEAYNALQSDVSPYLTRSSGESFEKSEEQCTISMADSACSSVSAPFSRTKDSLLTTQDRTSKSNTASGIPSLNGLREKSIVSDYENSARSSHSRATPVAGMPYTWSSRGPSYDGSRGVCVCAPGGAIAPVPVWSLSRKRLMNGTSMASPSAAGAIAAMVSYLKRHNIPYTSDVVRRAIENSARPLSLPTMLGTTGIHHPTESAAGRNSNNSDVVSVNCGHDFKFACGYGSIDILGALYILESLAGRAERTFTDSSARDREGVDSLSTSEDDCTHTQDGRIDQVCTPKNGLDVAKTRSALDWRYTAVIESSAPMSGRRNGASISGAGALGASRGIYLRSRAETYSAQRASVKLEAVRDDEENRDGYKSNLADMETTVFLQSSCDWVTVPSSLVLYGGGRTFPVVVDPTSLKAGIAHSAEISGYLGEECLSHSRVFCLPVTVAKPEAPAPGFAPVVSEENIVLAAGAVFRRFYEPPPSCSYALLRIEGGDWKCTRRGSSDMVEVIAEASILSDESRPTTNSLRKNRGIPSSTGELGRNRISGKSEEMEMERVPDCDGTGSLSDSCRYIDIHTVQIAPSRSYRETENRFSLAFLPNGVREFSFEVLGGATMELCIAQRWSSPGGSVIKRVEICFCGLLPNPTALHMPAGNVCFPRLDVINALPIAYLGTGRSQGGVSTYDSHLISGFLPRATLSCLARSLSPCHSSIVLLGARDLLPDGKLMFQLILEFEFEIFEASSAIRVTFPGLNGRVYDALVEGGPFVTVSDSFRQLVLTSDIYPEEKSLNRGTYFIRAAIRHENVRELEKFKDLQAVILFKISSITLDVYDSSHSAALASDAVGKGAKSRDWKGLLEPGETRTLYFSSPKKSHIPKWANNGDTLQGEFTVDEVLFPCGGDHRGHSRIPRYLLSMCIPPKLCGSDKSLADRIRIRERKSRVSESDRFKAKLPANESEKNSSDEENKWLEGAIRSMKMKQLKSYLKDGNYKDFDRMSSSVDDKLLEDLNYLLLVLQRHDIELCSVQSEITTRSSDVTDLVERVVVAADNIIARIDSAAVASHFGVHLDFENSDEVSKRKEFEQNRATLITALFRKTRALYFIEVSSACTDDGIGESTDHENVVRENESRDKSFRELSRWVRMDGKLHSSDAWSLLSDKSSPGAFGAEDIVLLCAKREIGRGRPGVALNMIDNCFGSNQSVQPTPQDIARFRGLLLSMLGWDHIAAEDSNRQILRYPKTWEPF